MSTRERKIELAAMYAMAGLMANPGVVGKPRDFARDARVAAEALVDELESPTDGSVEDSEYVGGFDELSAPVDEASFVEHPTCAICSSKMKVLEKHYKRQDGSFFKLPANVPSTGTPTGFSYECPICDAQDF